MVLELRTTSRSHVELGKLVHLGVCLTKAFEVGEDYRPLGPHRHQVFKKTIVLYKWHDGLVKNLKCVVKELDIHQFICEILTNPDSRGRCLGEHVELVGVDPLSLYLSLRLSDDERIVQALKTLMEGLPW